MISIAEIFKLHKMEKKNIEYPYCFPYKPYQVQVDLMDKIYDLLKTDKKIGLFESPTGTGKTMSLICSTLTWYAGKQPLPEAKSVQPRIEDDFLSLFGNPTESNTSPVKSRVNQLFKKRAYSQIKSTDIREIQLNLKKKREQREILQRQQAATKSEEDSHLLTYDSDNENKQKKLKEIAIRTQTLNKRAQASGVESSAKEVQIIFCTRTHSQMSQIVNEIKRTQFSAEVSVVPIVSRKGLCVHENMKDIPYVSLLNERCQDLCEKSKCPYNDHDLTEIMANYILEKPQDIEEIGQYAKDTKICGYFSSRKAAQEADVLITPYQSILSESTREALGISLNNKVVVFDEGHNIMETISSMNSVSVTLPQLSNSIRAIILYTEKYGSRMAPKNLKSLRDISDVIDKLQSYIQKHKFETETDQLQTLDVMDVLIQADLYKLDFQKISSFFDKSDLIRKINGFCTAMIQKEKQNLVQGKKQSDASNIISNSRSVLYAVKEFIRILQYKPEDGKLIIEKQNDIMALRYLCLNPTQTLKRMLDQVKGLIFISGTLEPSQEFNLLINKAKEGEVSRFNCAHIIPKQHFQGLIVSQFEDHQFDFRFQSRLNESQLKVLGNLILHICQNTPQEGGVIVFLQSYGFKNTFLNFLRKTEFLKFLGSSRRIFEESQDGVDIFPEYQKAITEAKAPSILFCVIGGKLSEGINFSDNLARTVIVCGLPFANSQSIEIKEKMHYYNQIGDANFTGNDYYENLCMKTLNQAIGRAIRHIGDFATIVLVDQRFSNLRIKRKLPKWMQESLVEIGAKNSRDEVQGLMTQFFKYFQK
ncbi:hypothetical protein FGO68_gene2312 [Halteria grandinella]|uniref:Helicase ATP-binding domain-containing protein n=1 Tax=Halteria grandinella TaxID=5974 RepID=A0A8J8T6E4_HALGN|nr:hypothetical protein FGO68_gene2312 [Halteria grandinella]